MVVLIYIRGAATLPRIHRMQNQQREHWSVKLQKWICHQHGVSQPGQVNPYRDLQPLWSVSASKVIRLKAQVPPEDLRLPMEIMAKNCQILSKAYAPEPRDDQPEWDLDNVQIYAVPAVEFHNPWDFDLGGQMIKFKTNNKRIAGDEKLQEMLNSVPGTQINMKNRAFCESVGGDRHVGGFLKGASSGPFSRDFFMSFGALNSKNIRNGCLQISPDDCRKIGLPLVGDHEKCIAESWWLIPHNHILQWPLDSSSVVKNKFNLEGYAIKFFDSKRKCSKILYWLTNDKCFETLIESIHNFILPTLSTYKLEEFGFRIYPFINRDDAIPKPAKEGFSARWGIGYVCWPKGVHDNPKMAPLWKDEYPSFDDFVHLSPADRLKYGKKANIFSRKKE